MNDKMNAYAAGYVYLPVSMIKLENRWTYLDEIWHGCYAAGIHP
jgi:hypothetical protein